MRFIPVLLFLPCLAGCASSTTTTDAPQDVSVMGRHEQVQLDVQAMMRGMNHARAQDEAIARARAP